MSTYRLPEAVHVSIGSADFDFPAGDVVATTVVEESALGIAVASKRAELVTYEPILAHPPKPDGPPDTSGTVGETPADAIGIGETPADAVTSSPAAPFGTPASEGV